MEIKKITTEELKQITAEGLVFQGCGGDPEEWVDGINEMLTEENILKDGARFTDVKTFEHDGLTNLIFNMENVQLDIGKLAMWRLATHGQFGATWASDYLPNKLGVEMGNAEEVTEKMTQESTKPDCALIGEDGNIFVLMGKASKALKRVGREEQATEMCDRIRASGSYDEALCILGEYVNITSVDEPEQDFCIQGY